MFERIGGSNTFRFYGIAVLVFCVIHIGLQKLLQRYSNGNGKDRCENNAGSADANDTITRNDSLLTGKANVDEKGN